MKNLTFKIFTCLWMTWNIINSQEVIKDEYVNQQETIQAIELTIDYFIQTNIKNKIPAEVLNAFKKKSLEIESPELITNNIEVLKSIYLRKKFFEINPSLKQAYLQPKTVSCEGTDDFEDDDVSTYYALFNGTPITIDTALPESYMSKVALVQSGYDPILNSDFTTPSVNLPKTQGERAIRINQNLGHYSPGTNDNAEIDILKKQFVAEDNIIMLDYAAVFERSTIHATDVSEHPYFRVTARNISTSALLSEKLIIASDTDEDLIEVGYSRDSTADLVYNTWKTITLDIGADNIGQDIVLEMEVRDCADSVHGGYVYVDNITYCGTDIVCDDDFACEDLTFELLETSECELVKIKLPTVSNACINATINWGDGGLGGSITLDGGIIEHTYDLPEPSGGYEDITINVSYVNGVTCEYTLDPMLDCNSKCNNCEANGIKLMDSFTLTQPYDSCSKVCFSAPTDFEECYTAVIDWGDGSATSIIDSSALTQCHTYTELFDPNVTIGIAIFNDEGKRCFKDTKDIVVKCIDCDLSCTEMANTILNSWTDTHTGICPQVCFDIPDDFDDCFTGTINWGDGNSTIIEPSLGLVCSNYTADGSYIIEIVIDKDGSDCRVEKLAEIDCNLMPKKQIALTLSPNPTKSNQTVTFKGVEYAEVIDISIYNIQGLLEKVIKPENNTLQIGKLNNGIYFIRFNTIYGEVQNKLIIN